MRRRSMLASIAVIAALAQARPRQGETFGPRTGF